MSDTEYRYVAARGVERKYGFNKWCPVVPSELAGMTAAELRKVANAMDGGATIQPDITVAPASDEEAAAILEVRRQTKAGLGYDIPRVWFDCTLIAHVLAALDRVTAEEQSMSRRASTAEGRWAFWKDQANTRDARIRDLEAQVAAISTALGVEHEDGVWWLPGDPSPVQCDSLADAVRATHRLADNDVKRAESVADDLRTEIARLTATAVVTDDEIMSAINDGRRNAGMVVAGYDSSYLAHLARALRPLLNRAAPEPQVVGACVVRDGEVSDSYYKTRLCTQEKAEWLAVGRAAKDGRGGTAHQLVLGAKIGEDA